MPFAVSRRFAAHIAAIPAEEIARQYRLLTESGATRRVLTFFIYIMAAFLSPLPVALLCCLLDFAAEWLGARQMKGLIPASQPRRYLATLVALVVSQAGFTTMLGFVYQSPAPLAAPFAAGVLTLTMLQLASIRVIHLPYAVTGLATTFCVALGAVIWNWPSRSGPAGLALTLLSLMAAAYFIHSVVRANHALHAGIAQEREAARLADLAKSRFLAQMSHELRTPLNAILGLGHAEMMQARDPEAVERMRLVTEAARGLAVILDDILDMAAIEAGHLPIRPVSCDPAREIAAAAELYRPLFEAQGLAVRLEISPAFPAHVVLDSQRLRQCLSNLFSNALKHTARGGVTLEARLAEVEGAQGRIEIRVTDTGPGIPPDETERIFQPFQRGTSSQPGTGLGLSITRALARSMGGDLVLVPGREGAQFLMTLAFAAPQAAPDRTGPPFAAPSFVSPSFTAPSFTAPSRPARTARVLIVDDIATNRLVARAHLRLLGVATDEAASGEAAVESIRAAPPDMVFLDMNMPGMDGMTTLRQIRKLPSRAARVPVIAMTADATEAHRRKYLEAGLDGYLAKPLTPEAVAEMVARFAPRGDFGRP